jgi:polyisoprenoid-binding protein YceI
MWILFCFLFESIEAQQYVPDASTSKVLITIKNVGMDTEGELSGMDGTIHFVPADLKSALFEISVKANSIKTGIDVRDNNLLSVEYLDANAHPNISFQSTQVTNGSQKGQYLMKGIFTIKGISKPVVFPFTVTEKEEVLLFTGNCRIKRSDYKIATGSVVLSDMIMVSLKVFAKKG